MSVSDNSYSKRRFYKLFLLYILSGVYFTIHALYSLYIYYVIESNYIIDTFFGNGFYPVELAIEYVYSTYYSEKALLYQFLESLFILLIFLITWYYTNKIYFLNRKTQGNIKYTKTGFLLFLFFTLSVGVDYFLASTSLAQGNTNILFLISLINTGLLITTLFFLFRFMPIFYLEEISGNEYIVSGKINRIDAVASAKKGMTPITGDYVFPINNLLSADPLKHIEAKKLLGEQKKLKKELTTASGKRKTILENRIKEITETLYNSFVIYIQNFGYLVVKNIFRGSLVIGGPGAGKTYSIVIPFLYYAIMRDFCLYVYDWKYNERDLTSKVLELMEQAKKHPHPASWGKQPKLQSVCFTPSLLYTGMKINPIGVKAMKAVGGSPLTLLDDNLTVLYNSSGGKKKSGGADFWENMGQQFLKGVGTIIYTLTPNLLNVSNIILLTQFSEDKRLPRASRSLFDFFIFLAIKNKEKQEVFKEIVDYINSTILFGQSIDNFLPYADSPLVKLGLRCILATPLEEEDIPDISVITETAIREQLYSMKIGEPFDFSQVSSALGQDVSFINFTAIKGSVADISGNVDSESVIDIGSGIPEAKIRLNEILKQMEQDKGGGGGGQSVFKNITSTLASKILPLSTNIILYTLGGDGANIQYNNPMDPTNLCIGNESIYRNITSGVITLITKMVLKSTNKAFSSSFYVEDYRDNIESQYLGKSIDRIDGGISCYFVEYDRQRAAAPVMDEFPTLGVSELATDISQVVAEARSKKIATVISMQDSTQLYSAVDKKEDGTKVINVASNHFFGQVKGKDNTELIDGILPKYSRRKFDTDTIDWGEEGKTNVKKKIEDSKLIMDSKVMATVPAGYYCIGLADPLDPENPRSSTWVGQVNPNENVYPNLPKNNQKPMPTMTPELTGVIEQKKIDDFVEKDNKNRYLDIYYIYKALKTQGVVYALDSSGKLSQKEAEKIIAEFNSLKEEKNIFDELDDSAKKIIFGEEKKEEENRDGKNILEEQGEILEGQDKKTWTPEQNEEEQEGDYEDNFEEEQEDDYEDNFEEEQEDDYEDNFEEEQEDPEGYKYIKE